MKAWMAAIAAALLLSACAAAGLPARRDSLARQIADDAATFNEAYGQAVSAQILLNIMRSRDRMPRYYLATTGISDSPSWRFRQNAGVGAIPLGEGASPWGVGALALERETQTRPSYAVQPFTAETLTRTAFEPTAPNVFAHYWHSGWPRDLLMLTMVEAIETSDGAGAAHIYVNEANTIFDDCSDTVQTQGCAFVRELRRFLDSLEGLPTSSIDAQRGREVCGLIGAYGEAGLLRPAAPREGMRCDPVFIVGAMTVRLRLRSLDDMIYYVGELLRAGSMQAAPGQPIEAQVTVNAAGLRGGGRGVPLFRVLPQGAADPNAIYAAEVAYGGVRYRAGPAIGRSCGSETSEGRCRDIAEEGDRSSSVLSLIAEILALNQSPDAIRAPSRLIAE